MKQIYLFLITLLCVGQLYGQRPENIYARKAIEKSNKTTLTTKSSAASVSLDNPLTTSSTCSSCYTVGFEFPDDSLMTIYSDADIWIRTYEYNNAVGDYKGYWNFEQECLNFMHYADTSYGSMSYWDGFTVSSTTTYVCDTSCSSSCTNYYNQFSAMPQEGAGSKDDISYAVAYDGYNEIYFAERHCVVTFDEASSICGLYLTLNAYTYKSIKCGDSYASAFDSADYFYVTMKGYLNGTSTGSVDYYLADYRSSLAYVVDDWKWVNLSDLGTVDSISFELTTSDVGTYGPNTPMYFCVDEIKVNCEDCAETDNDHTWFTTPNYITTSEFKNSGNALEELQVSIFPNPVQSQLTIKTEVGSYVEILNEIGVKILSFKAEANSTDISVDSFPAGLYFIRSHNNGSNASTHFIKSN